MKKTNTYQTERNNYLNNRNDVRKDMKPYMLVLGLVALIVFIYSVLSTVDMKMQDSQATKEYVENYTDQRADMVNMEITNGQATLIGITEDITQRTDTKDVSDVEAYLDQKRQLHSLDFLVFYNIQQGELLVTGEVPNDMDIDAFKQNAKELEEIPQGQCTTKIENQNIVYTADLYQNGEMIGVLCGGVSSDELQEIITVKSFKKRGSSYIIDGENQVLLAAESKEKFQSWDFIRAQNKNKKISENIEKMQEDLANGKNGDFRFKISNKRYYLAYAPTGVENWASVTIVPSDLFTGFSNEHMNRILGSLVGTMLIYLGLFFLLFKNYNENEERIKRLAFLDEVTGGINKLEFQMRYQELCRQKKADQYAIVLMNVADFKMINKNFGTNCGDKMLRYFYSVIVSFLREKDGEFAARTEVDHFFLCLKEKDPQKIKERLLKIVKQINSFDRTDLPKYRIRFLNGVSFVEDPHTDITVIQDQAREALKNQNNGNGDVCGFYDLVIAKRMQRQKDMEQQFLASIAARDFHVYMQPKVSLKKGTIEGAEALVRWECPGIGFISPNEFIPILENNGKIRILDKYVFEKVCIWMKNRKEQNKKLYPISVNLSRYHFMDTDFIIDYADTADKYSVERSLIEFEVTETILLDENHLEKVREGIRKIHEYGFKCALDDFGVGFSPLTLLRSFEIDVLKLDRSFFQELDYQKSQDVLSCIVELAEKLKIETVAEGIETKEQIELIKALRCDIVQGYYFSKPLPMRAFEEWCDEFEKNKKCENINNSQKIRGGVR